MNACKKGHIILRAGRRCDQCNRERALKWQRENPERAKARAEEWRAKNRDRDLAGKKQYRLDHLDRLKEIKRIAYLKNREIVLADHRRRYQEDRANRIEGSRLCRLQNPEPSRHYRRKRRAILAGCVDHHAQSDILEIREKQRGRCAYCRVKLKNVSEHVDHIVPLSKGGGNGRRNIQLLCETCNVQKHATDPVIFARRIGRLI